MCPNGARDDLYQKIVQNKKNRNYFFSLHEYGRCGVGGVIINDRWI